MTILVKLLIKIYRILFFWKKRTCRFYPTCSEYALLALEKHSFFNAIMLISKRILKCHPFHEGGVDYP